MLYLTFGGNSYFGCVLSAQKCEKIYLGRLPTYFCLENLPWFSLGVAGRIYQEWIPSYDTQTWPLGLPFGFWRQVNHTKLLWWSINEKLKIGSTPQVFPIPESHVKIQTVQILTAALPPLPHALLPSPCSKIMSWSNSGATTILTVCLFCGSAENRKLNQLPSSPWENFEGECQIMHLPVLPGLPVSAGSPIRNEGAPGSLWIPAATHEESVCTNHCDCHPYPHIIHHLWVALVPPARRVGGKPHLRITGLASNNSINWVHHRGEVLPHLQTLLKVLALLLLLVLFQNFINSFFR